MSGIDRSFDAARKALQRVAEATRSASVDGDKTDKKEAEKVEDSRDKAALGRVKDREVKPRALDKDTQNNSLSLGFGDVEGTKRKKKVDTNKKREAADQKVDEEWGKAAKASSKAADRSEATSKQAKKQKSQSIDNEFLVSLHASQDYYSLAVKDDPELQKLEELYKSINESNSKEVNEKNYTKLYNSLRKYRDLLMTKDKNLAESVFALSIYRLHEKIRNSPKMKSQGLKVKPLPPSMKPQAVILEARAQSDDKYYSGLLTAIAGSNIYLSTASYVRDANNRMLDLNKQEIDQVKQENKLAKDNMSGLETLIADSVDDGVNPEKAKKVIEAASTNILRSKIEKEIKETPKAKPNQESEAKPLIDQSLKNLKNIDDAFRVAIVPLEEKEPKLKDIFKQFKSLKKESKQEAKSEVLNEILASLSDVKSTYAKELVLYSLTLKAKEVGLNNELPKLETKLKELQGNKVDPREVLYANWAQVTFIHAGFHRPDKKPEHIQEDLKDIKKYFARKFKEPEDKVNTLIDREFRLFMEKYPRDIEI